MSDRLWELSTFLIDQECRHKGSNQEGGDLQADGSEGWDEGTGDTSGLGSGIMATKTTTGDSPKHT
jgi:hypothetical protein